MYYFLKHESDPLATKEEKKEKENGGEELNGFPRQRAALQCDFPGTVLRYAGISLVEAEATCEFSTILSH